MNRIFALSTVGLIGFGLTGCSTQSQTPTTASELSQMETDLRKPILVDSKPANAATSTDVAARMNTKVAPFSLPDASGKIVEVGNWGKSKATVIMFVATQCPVSNAYNVRVKKLAKDYSAKGVKFVGINSNKQENNAEIAEHSRENGFTFAVLKDKGNVVADKFDAKVTPEIYLVNAKGALVYHGQIDNSQNESKIKTRPLASAIDAVLAGEPVKQSEVAAFGCSIKREN